MWQFAAMHVHGAELGATMQRRHGLARIEQPLRIESGLERMHLFELGAGELHAHLVQLLHNHSVLTGHGAADFEAEHEDIADGLFRTLEFVVLVRVEGNQRMQITVARVENVGDWQPECGG